MPEPAPEAPTAGEPNDAILSPDGGRFDQSKPVGVAHAALAAEAATCSLVGRTVADVERDLILETLKHCLGNRSHAANILISIRTLRKPSSTNMRPRASPFRPRTGARCARRAAQRDPGRTRAADRMALRRFRRFPVKALSAAFVPSLHSRAMRLTRESHT